MTVYPDNISIAQTLLNQQETINEQESKIKRLQAENERLRAELDALRAAVATWKKSAKRHRHNERRKQKALEWGLAEMDRLRAALEPLAALWRDAYEDKPDDTPVYGLNDVVLRVGDIRAARQALRQAQDETLEGER